MKEKIDFYKRRVEAAVDKGIVEYEKGSKKIGELTNEMVSGSSKYKKLVAALEIVSEIMPGGIHKNLAGKLDQKDFSKLPFNPDKLTCKEKIGEGYVSKVYPLESNNKENPSYVIKLEYVNVGDTDKLAEIASQQKKEYEQIREYYKELPDLIPEEHSLIVNSRKDNKPVIATVSKFAGGELRDIFKDIKKEELVELLKSDDAFCREFEDFTRISYDLVNTKGEVIDLLGDKNLVVADKEGRPHLRFLDPHNITPSESGDEERKYLLKMALDYLNEVESAAKLPAEEERLAA